MFFVVLGFSSCTTVFKTLLSVKDPKVETDHTITKYLHKINGWENNNYVFDGSLDSLEIYQNLMHCFNNEPLIYKNQSRYCYAGQSKCPNVKIQDILNFEFSYIPCPNDSLYLREFLSHYRPLADYTELDIVKDRVYIIVYWSVFFKNKKYKKEYFARLKEICQNDSVDCEILLINTDLNSKWGLIPEKRMPFKVKLKRSKGVDLSFGRIPFA